jgi:hypothetical protein
LLRIGLYGLLLELEAHTSLLTLKEIVPNLVQLGDCRFEWQDKELFTVSSHESKAIKSPERIGNFEIKVDCKIFCKPCLDTSCNFGRR